MEGWDGDWVLAGRPVLGSGWREGSAAGVMPLVGGPWNRQHCPLAHLSCPAFCPGTSLLGIVCSTAWLLPSQLGQEKGFLTRVCAYF